MELVTGRAGSPHITSQQDRQKHQGIWGDGAYILATGNMLEPEVQSSNKILIKDGALMFQGALFSVKVGTTDEITINNGNQGMQRKDLVVARYTYDSSQNIESAEWVVIQGTPAASNPVAPTGTDGDIQAGDSTVDCPFMVVNLDGINVTGVDIIPEKIPTLPDLIGKTYDKTEGILGLNSRTYILKRYRDGIFELNGRADASRINMQYSESSNKYFAPLTVLLPDELDLADDRYIFTAGTESGGLYDVTLVSISGRTMTIYLSTNNYTGEIPIVKIGFNLNGHWK